MASVSPVKVLFHNTASGAKMHYVESSSLILGGVGMDMALSWRGPCVGLTRRKHGGLVLVCFTHQVWTKLCSSPVQSTFT